MSDHARKSEHQGLQAAQAQMLARLINSMDSTTLWRSLGELLSNQVAFDQFAVFRYDGKQPPARLYDANPGPERDRLHLTLLRAAYVLSPYLNQVVWADKPDGFYPISSVSPDDFTDSEFYRVYYSEKHVVDEGLFCVRIDDTRVIGLILERVAPSKPFGQQEIMALDAVSSLVSAAVKRHCRLPQEHDEHADRNELVSEQMSSALMRFGTSVLTDRERDIAGLILRGHSSKAAARELGIASETERVHRKRLYARLKISSHAELFWIFIEAFSYFDPTSEVDPLQSYLAARDNKQHTQKL